jgi:putative PEP-CTERM system TPR-repeat lipoprotein
MRFRFLPILAALIALSGCSLSPEAAKRRYLEHGDKYFEQGKFREAIILYRNAIKKDPRFGEAYFKLGEAELRRGDPRAAVSAYRRAVELLKNNEDAGARLADLYLAAYAVQRDRKNPALLREVDDLARTMFQKNPNSFQGTRLQAFLAVTRGEISKSIELFRKADSLKPKIPELRFALVQVLARDNQWEEAEKVCREILADTPKYTPAYDFLLVEYIRKDRRDDAEKLLQLKAANNPGVADFRLQLAGYYLETQRKELSEKIVAETMATEAKDPTARLKVGDFYVRTRNFDRAIQIYREGAALGNDRQVNYLLRIAQVYAAQQKIEDARRELEAALKLDPKNSPALSMRASLDLQYGTKERKDSAIKDLQGLLSATPNDVIVRYNLGRAYQQRGELEAARVQFAEAIKRRPDFVAGQIALSQVYIQKRDYGKALTTIEDALKYAPKNLAARSLKIQALVNTGNLRQAKTDLEEFIKENPDSPDLVFQSTVISFQEGRFKEAEAGLLKLRARFPDDVRLTLGLADVYFRSGRPEEAFKVIEAEAAKRPDDVTVQTAAGVIALRTDHLPYSEKIFRALLAKEPKNVEHMVRLAEVLRRTDRVDQAISTLREASKAAPGSDLVNLQLAMTLDIVGRQDQSQPLYQEVLKKDPNNVIALNNLAYLLAEDGRDLDQALTLAQRAKQQAPNNDDITDTMGLIYIKKNLTDNAITIFVDLVKRQPKNPLYHFHLGMAQLQKGNRAAARQSLQTALQLKPSKQDELRIKEVMSRAG